MSATAIQVPTHATVNEKEWVKLFPREVTGSYTNSVTFIKQLTVVAVSTITYLKNAFPEDSYYNETFAGLKIKMLKDKCGDELAQFVSNSLKQAFDAFDKKYVHQLALCFYSGECTAENLIEYHVFEYSYNSEGITLNINSKNRNNAKNSIKCSMDSVKTRTAMLVRSLSLFVYQNCLAELPTNYDVSLRLYYNEDSPEDYQAPGFCACSQPDHLQRTAALCLGWVETPYHKLIARAFVRDLYADSDAAVPSDNQPEITQDNEEFQAECSTRDPESESSLEPVVRCPCGKQDAVGQSLVTCQYCNTQQHAACFGLAAPVAEHCCAACADADPGREPSCALLRGLERRKQECVCIFRRTLAMCARRAVVTGVELQAKFELTTTSTAKMIRLMQSHYILPSADSQDLAIPRSINPLRLKLAIKKFFRMDAQDDNMADRMMAETDTTDPIGEVLSPIQKVTLNSNLGTFIEHVADAMGSEDPTSQELRELDLPSQDITEDLPLSGSHNPVNKVVKAERKLKRKQVDDMEWTPTKLSKLRSGASIKSKKKI